MPLKWPESSMMRGPRRWFEVSPLLDREVSTPGPAFPDAYPLMEAFVRAFRDRGGMLVAGTDQVRPGIDLHTEIRLLRRAGLPPAEALLAATGNASLALGRPDLGVIQAGRLADAVVYAEDPLGAEGNTLAIRNVIKGGVVYDADALLEPIRHEYRMLRVRAIAIRIAIVLSMLLVPSLVTVRLIGRRRSRA